MQTIKLSAEIALKDCVIAALAAIDRKQSKGLNNALKSDGQRAQEVVQRMFEALVLQNAECFGVAFLAGYNDGAPYNDQGDIEDLECPPVE